MRGRRQKKIPVYKFLQRNKVRTYPCSKYFSKLDLIGNTWKINFILCTNLHHTGTFDIEACQYWDKFYRMHQDKFFKDRRWLFLEFPELLPSGGKSQARNRNLGDQQAIYPLPTGSSGNTETRHQQHNGPTHHHRSADTSNHQESSQGAERENDEAAVKTFPGQHASFRILEVFKTVHMYYSFVLIQIVACGPCYVIQKNVSNLSSCTKSFRSNKYQQNIFSLHRLDVGWATVYFPS